MTVTRMSWRFDERSNVGNDAWKNMVRLLIDKTATHYSSNTRWPAGLDLRRTYPFVGQELMQADICAHALSPIDGDTIGFALVKHRNTKCLYLALLVSFEPGVGRMLIDLLMSSTHFSQEHIILRSTDAALGFYLHLGFTLVDWETVSELGSNYCTDECTDAHLTTRLARAVAFKDSAEKKRILHVLTCRDWCEHDVEEWPLLLPRTGFKSHMDSDNGCRRSPRLLGKKMRKVHSAQ